MKQYQTTIDGYIMNNFILPSFVVLAWVFTMYRLTKSVEKAEEFYRFIEIEVYLSKREAMADPLLSENPAAKIQVTRSNARLISYAVGC